MNAANQIKRVPDRRTVLATHQLLEFGARDRRRVPFRRREPGRDGLVGLRTDKAVIASDVVTDICLLLP